MYCILELQRASVQIMLLKTAVVKAYLPNHFVHRSCPLEVWLRVTGYDC
jgi:hypothetical protein